MAQMLNNAKQAATAAATVASMDNLIRQNSRRDQRDGLRTREQKRSAVSQITGRHVASNNRAGPVTHRPGLPRGHSPRRYPAIYKHSRMSRATKNRTT